MSTPTIDIKTDWSHYTRSGDRTHYSDDDGRTLTLVQEELTVSEETCEGRRVEAAITLPGPGEEIAVLLLRDLMAAMGLDDRYDLTPRAGA